MKERARLVRLLLSSLEAKRLAQEDRYKERLKRELKEIDAQGEHDYLLALYDKFHAENLIFPHNEHNNLIDYLLGLAPSHNIDNPSTYVQGEFPDIDIDYNKTVRDYLKREWAPKVFGQEYICAIATYGTSGIKGAALDMARVHSIDKDEIQAITKKIQDKDDEGVDVDWDRAVELYPEFSAWCEKYPDVSIAAKTLQNRIRNGGVHAGGLVISNQRIDGFVPLEVRSVKKETPNGIICSAWTEGQATQDLQPVGLIKFDLLVINNLMQVALACKLVKERHGLKQICAAPGQWDWTDISYLNDPKALEMADKGDLRCIFQFDGEGIRKLVKRGGVTSFDDLAAYSSLYRPGPLNMGMDVHYCRRKKGEEPYSIHPVMHKSLGVTYGVMAYQEQVMDILREVGGIPDMHTEKVRKAISKKKVKQFIKYKEQFIEHGQQVLNSTREFVENLWAQIESFAEYGFNKSHSYAYTYISSRLLWLKAHFPLEFYTAILMCESDEDKFRDYKLDAKYHGIEICPVHINKSKANFNIEDGKIYFGFGNIKGIGEGVAEKIVAGQPYRNFEDFLERFGTDASVVKALVALGIFEDQHERLTMRKYSEYYKEAATKRKQRDQRYANALQKKKDDLKALLLSQVREDDPDFELMCAFNDAAGEKWMDRFSDVIRHVPYKYKGQERFRDVSFFSILEGLREDYQNKIESHEGKLRIDSEVQITLDRFNPTLIKLDPKEEKLLKSELVIHGQRSYPEAESLFYGFQWTHILEACTDFKGETIDKMIADCESDPLVVGGPVEIQINSVIKRTSKNNVTFYSVEIEDANSKKMKVNIWSDDYNRFEPELKKGTLMRMHVRPPSGGFNTLTFFSYPKQERHRKIPKNKEDDLRIVLLKLPEAPKKEAAKTDFKYDSSILEV